MDPVSDRGRLALPPDLRQPAPGEAAATYTRKRAIRGSCSTCRPDCSGGARAPGGSRSPHGAGGAATGILQEHCGIIDHERCPEIRRDDFASRHDGDACQHRQLWQARFTGIARPCREICGRRRCAPGRGGIGTAELVDLQRRLARTALFGIDADRHRQRCKAQARVVHRIRYHPRPGGNAAGGRWRDVRLHRVEQGLCARRPDRQTAVVLRPQSARHQRRSGVLRCG
jgi:hypothetical protein